MFKLLDTVVLTRDVPEAGLRQGDLGAIVEVYGANSFEVEFGRGFWSDASAAYAERGRLTPGGGPRSSLSPYSGAGGRLTGAYSGR